jgi:hypothetical protein
MLLIASVNGYSQSKKEQIEILTNKVDSLNQILNAERNINLEKIKALNSKIDHFAKDLFIKNTNLRITNKIT